MAAVAGGARLIATNADARYPTPAGFLPGAGAIVAALATATGVTPEVIGKPAPAMFVAILEASGMAPSECVVVGDNPDADVAGAHRAGCSAILVLTGVADRGTVALLDGERVPEAIAADPDEVRVLLALAAQLMVARLHASQASRRLGAERRDRPTARRRRARTRSARCVDSSARDRSRASAAPRAAPR